MNITFLIGNGFDIGLKLETQYEKFYPKYCKFDLDDNDNISDFKYLLSDWQDLDDEDENGYKKIVDWADFERAFGKHAKNFTLKDKRDYLERFEHFVMEFNKHLESEEAKIDYSNKKLIAEKMGKAVTTYFHIRTGDKNRIQTLYNRIAGQRVYNFISFNYTKTLDTCVRIFDESLKNDGSRKVGNICHIHGYIDRNMILGVDNEDQIENPELAQDIEVVNEIVKPKQNQESRTNYENDAISLINNSHIICVYGMSIGETDKKWWNIISKWLLGDSNRALVILRHDDNYTDRFTFTQNKTIDKITNKYLDMLDLSNEQKEKIKPQIYVGVNNDVFGMDLLKKENKPETIVIDIAKDVAPMV